MLSKEELCWMDKGGAPFIGWSINMAGTFPQRWKLLPPHHNGSVFQVGGNLHRAFIA